MKEPRAIDTKSRVATRAHLSDRLPPASPVRGGLAPLQTGTRRGGDETGAATTYAEATQSFIRSAADVPPRHTEPRGAPVVSPPFTATSSLQHGAHAGVGEADSGFFSRVRAEERRDDEARHGLDSVPSRSGAGRMQRTVDIMRRRENDPTFAPSRESYEAVDRRTPNGIPPPTRLESVRFTYAMPRSSHQMDYKAPEGQVPAALSPLFGTQRRVITECATSRDLFYATTKARAAVLPGYMSHVPGDEGTLSMMQGEHDVLRRYAQAGHMAAAKPGSIAAPVRERSAAAKAATSQGFYLEQAVSSPNETVLNRIKCGKKSAVLN